MAEFIVPNRKRAKNQNSKITTSTPKRKKRNNIKKASTLTTSELEDNKKTNGKQKYRRSNVELKSNQRQEKSSTSTEDIFETIRNEKSIIFSISDTEVKKKKEDSLQDSKSLYHIKMLY